MIGCPVPPPQQTCVRVWQCLCNVWHFPNQSCFAVSCLWEWLQAKDVQNEKEELVEVEGVTTDWRHYRIQRLWHQPQVSERRFSCLWLWVCQSNFGQRGGGLLWKASVNYDDMLWEAERPVSHTKAFLIKGSNLFLNVCDSCTAIQRFLWWFPVRLYIVSGVYMSSCGSVVSLSFTAFVAFFLHLRIAAYCTALLLRLLWPFTCNDDVSFVVIILVLIMYDLMQLGTK